MYAVDTGMSVCYTGEIELSGPVLAKYLARTSGQIQAPRNATATGPLQAQLLLGQYKRPL